LAKLPILRFVALALASAGSPLAAQQLTTPAEALPIADAATPDAPLGEDEVAFTSAQLEYDSQADIVTAAGDVRMARQGHRLRADKVVWNRATGEVQAEGNVAVTSPSGETAYGDRVRLTDTLRDGAVENLLLVLADGGRLAAERGTRVDGVSTLVKAAYTPCPVVDSEGCPKEPIWKISAVSVVHDPKRARVSYRDARLSVFGLPILWLPAFSHPDGSGSGGSGLLVPDIRISRNNGLQVSLPYYYQIAPNRDLTITPTVYSKVLPAIGARYRELNSLGAFQIEGMATYGRRASLDANSALDTNAGRHDLRGYFALNGTLQFDPYWSLTAATRLTTDRTFLRRYDISRDDRLRSILKAERIDDDSYLSIAGYAVQTLRLNRDPGQQPIALPAIDYRLRVADPLLDGTIELQLNSLSIIRTEGQDTQRAFAGARWDLRRLTDWGQELTFTAYARGDVYHTDDSLATLTPAYRGRDGWHGRGIAAFAADMRWPFVGEAFGGTQRITPRFQLVASPPTANLAIPNEDARGFDLEDSNIFALNRFPGYDRWEDGTRATYGFEYAFDRPRFSLRTIVGQSYRLTDKDALFPQGTGLTDKLSDIVGRTSLKYGRLIELTHRYRIDKDSMELRRNEIDATVGTQRTYVTAGYIRLNRDIEQDLEDLQDREEIRLGARAQVTTHWSLFGSTVIDLTGRGEDVLSVSDGYEPVRHRLGFLYEDECFEFGVTWRRDYDFTGDAGRGNTYLLRLAFKNLGR
jgi:LPS-assembly protein